MKKQADKYVESMDSTVQAAESRKVAGQKKLEFTETVLGRVQNLVPSGAKTQEDLDRANLEFVQSQAAQKFAFARAAVCPTHHS